MECVPFELLPSRILVYLLMTILVSVYNHSHNKDIRLSINDVSNDNVDNNEANDVNNDNVDHNEANDDVDNNEANDVNNDNDDDVNVNNDVENGMCAISIPTNVHAALKHEKWKESMLKELKQLESMNTWRIVSKNESSSQTRKGTSWNFRIKPDGTLKSKLCFQGFRQIPG
eukprot:Awhi_evm1s15218